MKVEDKNLSHLLVVSGEVVEDALRRAVLHALLEHNRAGNQVATWEDNEVRIVPTDALPTVAFAERIEIDVLAERIEYLDESMDMLNYL
jgi:hypothetical protein